MEGDRERKISSLKSPKPFTPPTSTTASTYTTKAGKKEIQREVFRYWHSAIRGQNTQWKEFKVDFKNFFSFVRSYMMMIYRERKVENYTESQSHHKIDIYTS